MQYASIHSHTHYSQFDGIGTPVAYAERAVEIGMPAVAITDHGTLSGHREWYREMKAVGVKPILGIEAYYTEDRFDKRDKSDRTEPLDLIYNHLIVIAKNQAGLQNLNTMNRLAWTEGYYKKPRMDWDLLTSHKEGLIISSACMSGVINKAIEHGEFATAKRQIGKFHDEFGDDFYIEVMPHNSELMNVELIKLADEMGVKVVVTPDCHHVYPDQKVVQEIALLMQTHSQVVKGSTFEGSTDYKDMMERLDYLYGDDRMLTFRNFDIHLLSGDEMWSAMGSDARPDMFKNTIDIANSIEEYDIPRNLNLLPVRYRKPDDKLRELALSGLEAKGLADQEYLDRLDEELAVIGKKKFAPYFLMVQNVVSWAKDQGILVGDGRGSAAGSLVCYAIGITNVDPIEHDLLFFRFIDPSRSDWPDIDLDFQDSRRNEVKEFLIKQYGHVSAIATFLTFKDKGIVRDMSRVLNIPLSEVNKVLKKVETWEEFTTSPATQEFREKYPEVVEYGAQLRGLIRGSGTHPAGMVASKVPIANVAPVETRTQPGKDERQEVVALDMNEVADVGLVKIDFLGLKTLTVVDDCLKILSERGVDIDFDSIPLDDQDVYKMLSDGHTMAVFQAEAVPYTNLLRKMGVSNLDELAASNALVRPGAMNSIGQDYIDRKNGRVPVNPVHPIYDEIGRNTFGLISLYQEQIMLAVTRLAGMSWEDANKIRKIIGKKGDPKEFDKYRDKFITGASENISKELAAKLWSDFEKSANYQFNKSHAVAYSLLTYRTAWLKHHYPLEYMYAALKNEKDKDMRTDYLLEAKRLGINIKLPHVNESDVDFKIDGGSLRFGLASIKYVSDVIANRYIKRRPFSSYKELEEFTFTKGSGVNSRALEMMRRVGAATFKDRPPNQKEIRDSLYEVLNIPEFTTELPSAFYDKITDLADYDEGDVAIVFAMARNIKRGKGWSRVEFVDKTGAGSAFDKEQTDIESGRVYLLLLSDNRVFKAIPSTEVADMKHGLVRYLSLSGMPLDSSEYYVVALKARTTKAGKKMADLILANKNDELAKVVCFSKEFPRLYMKVKEGNAYKMVLGATKEGSIVFRELG